MISKRESLEAQEKTVLAPYAVKSGESRGRAYPEKEDPYRTSFQRDRDRIIHCKAFRRLRGKTQVFVAHYGDHYRSRLAHSIEVAQLSRDIARMLNLNEDLAESIGLAHDLGHTPFAHAGQDEMHEIMQTYGSRFEHNEQSKRVVEVLEEKSPHFPGLNLTFEVTDGLHKHRTKFDNPQTSDTLMPSIEAQIVNIADEIAYMNHDIDDSLRSKILTFDDFEGLDLWKEAKDTVEKGLPEDFRIMAMISALIKLMVNDLALHTDGLISKHQIKKVDQVYQTANVLSSFSSSMGKKTATLKEFLYERFYTSPGVAEYNQRGRDVIRFLFESLMKNPQLLPEKHRPDTSQEPLHIRVKDYIAGMTDNFALSLYNELK